MLDKKYFEGQQNIGEGNRRGDDKILSELLPWASDEYVATGSDQEVPHSLGVVPSSVLVVFTHVDAAPATSTVVSSDAEKVVVNVTIDNKFKVLVF